MTITMVVIMVVIAAMVEATEVVVAAITKARKASMRSSLQLLPLRRSQSLEAGRVKSQLLLLQCRQGSQVAEALVAELLETSQV